MGDNRDLLIRAARALGDLVDELVFVGGCATDTVVDGRPELISELHAAPPDVRRYLSTEVRDLLAESAFIDALPGFLPPDSANQARIHILLARLREIADRESDGSD